MIRHLLKLVWNRKRTNALIIAEIFLSFIVIFAVLTGAIGFVLSVGALALLNRAGWIPHASFDVNLRIFLWGMLIAALFGVISGVWPAWRMSRMHPVNALRGGVA